MAEREQVSPIAVEPSGVVFSGRCEIQSPACTAREQGALTAVWAPPGRSQVNACGRCIEEMVRIGEWRIVGARLPPQADIAILDAARRPVLVVEVKKRLPFSEDEDAWAARIHRNLIVHGALPAAPYFLLVTFPGSSYLWVEPENREIEVTHFAKFEANDEIRPLLQGPESIANVQRAVAEWLQKLIDLPRDAPRWCTESGLAQRVAGGQLVRNYHP